MDPPVEPEEADWLHELREDLRAAGDRPLEEPVRAPGMTTLRRWMGRVAGSSPSA